MSRTILAEYDAEHKTSKLEEPLEGVEGHKRFKVTLEEADASAEQPWRRYCGVLSREAGASFAKAIEEAGFGPAGD